MRKKGIRAKVLSFALATALAFSGILPSWFVTPTVEVEAAETATASSYGLMDNIQDGTILHCFDWKYTDIIAELPNIAAAGFTSVQTSPAQPGCGTDIWWGLYQPLGFYVGTNQLGTKDELTRLCSEADKYGIKVVVDVVANHLAGDHSNIQNDLKDSQYWHTFGGNVDWTNRWQVTHGEIGMPDLNSEHSYVQQVVAAYINELKACGVDGIRWDAAKHIAVPSEDCKFWPAVTSQGLWHYGEILVGPDDSGSAASEKIMAEYTNYMTVTDSSYGKTLRDAFASGQVSTSYGNWAARGVSNDKLIYWAESHDTWSNNTDWGYSHGMSQNVIDRAYAVAASRDDICALYFSRPSSNVKDNIKAGQKGSTAFKSEEVSAVNHFHNAKNGEKDYYTTGSNCAVVNRETGAVVVAGSGGNFSVSVPNGGSTSQPGDYYDAITGEKWTVTSTTLSGKIGSSGIAVLYKDGVTKTPTPTISQQGGTFKSDTLTLTIGLSNATSGTYKIGNGATQTYTGSTTITIGSDMDFGDSVTIYLTATGEGGTVPKEYTFTKAEGFVPPYASGVYYENTQNWSSVYVYFFDTTTVGAEWPGKPMTKLADGTYAYEFDASFNAQHVIFNNGSGGTVGSTQTADLDLTKNGLYNMSGLKEVVEPITNGKVTVKYVDESGKEIASSKSFSGKVGSAYTTSAVTVDGYTLKETPKNASGTYTSSTITVTYVYAEVGGSPKVTASVASGTSFKTETQTITLTLFNAVSGTYSVDGGPTKTFTGTADVVLGRGKIADSTVTVKATATSSDGTTKNFTFTYEKQFNGTVNEVSKTASASLVATDINVVADSQGLASQYQTNTVGVGTKKTISVDGDLSDWNSSMLIAQGAANDDPRVYRDNSMYEIPIDLYALYGAYDDNNLYLMWEMTNVQDVVAPNDNYPLSQGVLWQTQELPFFILVDTGDSSTAIGNNGELTTGGTIWNSGMTVKQSFNKLISINTKGGNGPWVYGGDSTGLNPVEELDATTSNVKMKYGLGKLSKTVMGIDKAYGQWNNRVVGDVCNDNAAWVDFNTLGHNTNTMDFFYEVSIPLSELGVTSSDVASRGLGVLLVATMGKSGMDCLPYDVSMNDNADIADTESQEFNSFEKSDEDFITTSFARIGNGTIAPPPADELELNFGADKSAPQLAGTALTLGGIAQGGKAPYTYKFYVDNTLVGTKSGSGETSVSWTPSTAGTYVIKCVVTDAEGTSVTSAKYYEVETKSGDVTTLTASMSASSTSITKGGTVKFTAKASGGTSPYKYTFAVSNNSGSTWTNLVQNSSSNAYTWTASATGTYKFVVTVTDTASNTAKSTVLTVTVSGSTSTLNGLCQASDGKWYYYVNGDVDKTYAGLAQNSYGWWYVKSGTVDFTFTGLTQYGSAWWYVKAGKLDTTYTGLGKNQYGTWYVEKGRVNLNVSGFKNVGSTWAYLTKGKVDTTYTGLAQNSYGWWYVKAGTVDFTYTGLAKNSYGTWYVEKGKVNLNVSGFKSVGSTWAYLTKGKVDTTYTGLAQNSYGWWYVKAGTVDFTYTGLAKNSYGTWYVEKGKVNLTVSGLTKIGSTWTYLTKGKVDTTYTGLAQNNYGWWYIKAGELQSSYTGMVKYKDIWWYVAKGKLDTSYTGLAKNEYGWWHMTDGVLDKTYTGVSKNAYGYWYVKNGKVDQSYNGTVKYNGVTYTVTNGKVNMK